jgi:hypothetical protein
MLADLLFVAGWLLITVAVYLLAGPAWTLLLAGVACVVVSLRLSQRTPPSP